MLYVELAKQNITEMKNFVSKYFIPSFPEQDQKIEEFMTVFDKFLASLIDPSIIIEDPDAK